MTRQTLTIHRKTDPSFQGHSTPLRARSPSLLETNAKHSQLLRARGSLSVTLVFITFRSTDARNLNLPLIPRGPVGRFQSLPSPATRESACQERVLRFVTTQAQRCRYNNSLLSPLKGRPVPSGRVQLPRFSFHSLRIRKVK